MIPKTIFQTHEKKYEDLPDFIKTLSKTWINLNPNYQYIYMNSNERRNYIKEKCPDLLNFYDIMPEKQKQFNWHFPYGVYQSDLWRYVITYFEGGFYADMDSICLSSLDNLYTKNYNNQEIVAFGSKCSTDTYSKLYKHLPASNKVIGKRGKRSINNSNFGSCKHSTALKEIIDTIINKNNPNLYDVNYNPEASMGPAIFSNAILNNYNKTFFITEGFCEHNHNYQKGLYRLEDQKQFSVNYLGQTMSYYDLLKLKNIT